MIDEKTPNLGLPLPHPTNKLNEDVDRLRDALALLDGAVPEAATTAAWSRISNKPSTFPPSSHAHPVSEVANLQTTLNTKADVTALNSGLTLKADKTTVTTDLAKKADVTAMNTGLAKKADLTAFTALGTRVDGIGATITVRLTPAHLFFVGQL